MRIDRRLHEAAIAGLTWVTTVCVLAFAICSGCSGAQSRSQIEQATVTGLAGAYDTIVATEVPEEVAEHVDMFGETIRLGQVAVDACRVAKDGGVFLDWLGIGLRATFTVIAILDEAGVNVPPFLMAMVDGINIMIGGDKDEDKIDKGLDYDSGDSRDSGIVRAHCIRTGKIGRDFAGRYQCHIRDNWWHLIPKVKTPIPEMKTVKDYNRIRI